MKRGGRVEDDGTPIVWPDPHCSYVIPRRHFPPGYDQDWLKKINEQFAEKAPGDA